LNKDYESKFRQEVTQRRNSDYFVPGGEEKKKRQTEVD
jgi:hypothetical protein